MGVELPVDMVRSIAIFALPKCTVRYSTPGRRRVKHNRHRIKVSRGAARSFASAEIAAQLA
jgi:hypothetical protein